MTIIASSSGSSSAASSTSAFQGTSSIAADGSGFSSVAPGHTETLRHAPTLFDEPIEEEKEKSGPYKHYRHTSYDEKFDYGGTATTSVNISAEDLGHPSIVFDERKKLDMYGDWEKTLATAEDRRRYADLGKQLSRNASFTTTLHDDQHSLAEAGKPDDETQGPEVLSVRRFLPLFLGFVLTVFLVSLDNTVVATAQVEIAKDLNGQSAIAWLPTTFLIGQASFSIFFGQTLAFFSSKHIFLVALFLFELGSVVSGVANTMNAMLAGRTVSGVGAAGLFMSVMQIMAETTTVTARAQYMGILGAVFAISMVAGPLIGGALTDHVSWRWVFYINLPIGGAAWALTLFLFPNRPPLGSSKTEKVSLLHKLTHIDIVGLTLFTGLVCMLVIPIQQGHQNGWTTAITWAPIACGSLVVVLSYFWLRYMGSERALMPLSLFGDLNFIGCAILSFFTFWNAITFTYLIPLFFQCVRGHTATQSGVDMLALMITLALCSLVTGVVAKHSGQYYPQLLVGPLFGVAGSVLYYFQKTDSGLGFQIGTQILLGLGTGAIIQMPILTVQANITDRKLLATATSFIVFMQRLGGGIGSSVSGAVIAAQLQGQVLKHLPPTSDPRPYAGITPEAAYGLPPGPDRDGILQAVNKTITFVYIGGAPVFAIIWLAILFTVRIKNIKTQKVTRKVDVFRAMVCLPKRKQDEQVELGRDGRADTREI